MVHKTGRIPKIKPSGSPCYIENKKTKKKKVKSHYYSTYSTSNCGNKSVV